MIIAPAGKSEKTPWRKKLEAPLPHTKDMASSQISQYVDSDEEIQPMTYFYNTSRILQEDEEMKLRVVTAERDFLRQESAVAKMTTKCVMMQTELAQIRIKKLEFELKIAQEENLGLSLDVQRLKRKINESEEEQRRHGTTQRKQQKYEAEIKKLEDGSESDSSSVRNSTTGGESTREENDRKFWGS